MFNKETTNSIRLNKTRELSDAWEKEKITVNVGKYKCRIHPSEIKFCNSNLSKDYSQLLTDVLNDFGSTTDSALTAIFNTYGDNFTNQTSEQKISHMISLVMNDISTYLYNVRLGRVNAEKSYRNMITYINNL